VGDESPVRHRDGASSRALTCLRQRVRSRIVDTADLKRVSLFADLSRSDLRKLAQWTDEVDVDAGTPLVREGEYAYEFFVIEEGTAEVTLGGEVIAELGPGEYFGEIALLARTHRTASVIAKTPMRLVVMFMREFASMADAFPKVAERVRAAMEQRLEGSD
jgi:CRP/FNR family transcriptional regulator, cyclic AMP receptor protein